MQVTAKENDMNFEDTPPDEKFFAGFDKQVLKVRTVRARDAEIEDLKALLSGSLLGFAAERFRVEADPIVDQIDALRM